MTTSRCTRVDTSDDTSEALHLALRCGAARFLRLEELLAVLNSCALLRFDAVLARQSVVETTDFDLFLAVLTDVTALASDSRRLHDLWTADYDSRLLLCRDVAATPRAELCVQILALVAFLKQRVMRWCFVYEALNPEALQRDVLVSVRPALIPIEGSDALATHVGDLRSRLNAMASGFGDAFAYMPAELREPRESLHRSHFGAHWENIDVDKRTGRVECRVCTAAQHAVAFYRRQAALFIERFNERLAEQQRTWRAAAASDHATCERDAKARAEAFRLTHFPPDAYIVPDALRWTSAEVLQHMHRHGRLQRDSAFGAESLQSPFDVHSLEAARCLSLTYLTQCRTFYQPLKQQLTRQFKHVGRVQLIAHRDDNERVSAVTGAGAQTVEFVGGVDTATRSLCGVYCSFQ